MYMNRLIEFAELNEDKFPPLGFKQKKVHWIADIQQDGLILSPSSGREMIVPEIARSSGTTPILLVDKPDYVFGFYDKERDAKRSKERHLAYLSLLEQFVEETGNVDVHHLLSLLQQSIKRPPKMKMGDFVAFRIRDEQFLHEQQEVREYWSKFVNPELDRNVFRSQCMFCKKQAPIMQRHSISFLVGPDRTKLISANANAYESHGLNNSFVAPTCFVCEQKYGKALEYLLQPHSGKGLSGGKHMYRVGNLTYVFWVRQQKMDLSPIAQLLNVAKEQSSHDVQKLLSQAFKGIVVERETSQFCVMALSAAKGRLVVREYVEASLGQVSKQIERFFEAQQVGAERFYGIYTLAATAYSEPRSQMQPFVIEEWMNWFLRGKRLSNQVLIPIMKRIQAKGTMFPQDAAAVNSWWISQGEGSQRGMLNHEENDSKAYVTGRLFAVLEKIQQDAIGSEQTIASKYFGAASTTPKAIIGLLIRNAQYHLTKLRSEKKGWAIELDKKLGLILEKIADDFPTTLKLTEQAEFALGYYHEKQQLWSPKKKEVVQNEDDKFNEYESSL